MGVDYNLVFGKKTGNKVIPVHRSKHDYFGIENKDYIFDAEVDNVKQADDFGRCAYYTEFFQKYKNKIIKLAGRKISFDFIECDWGKEFSYLEPDDLIATLKLILRVLKSNAKKFPYFYDFDFGGGGQDIDHPVFIGDERVNLIRGENKCYMYFTEKVIREENTGLMHFTERDTTTEEKKTVDLRGMKIKKFKCRVYNVEHLKYGERIRADENMIIEATPEEDLEYYKLGPVRIYKLFEEDTCQVVKKSLYEYYGPAFDCMIKSCEFAKKKGYLIRGQIL